MERVEPRLLFHLEVITPLPDVNATPGGSQAIDLAAALGNPEVVGSVVRLTTSAGPIDLEMFDAAAPQSVANFLNYVNTDQYNGTIIHRAVTDFVVQGGGYRTDGSDITGPGTPTVPNEFSPTRSNVRGTVAYAKLGPPPGQPPTPETINSATSEWFINLGDNASNLDNQNGGFTVFGRVLGNGMTVADAIDALPKTDATVGSRFFQDLPTLTPTPTPTASDLVVLQDAAVVPEATYSVTSSDPALVNAAVVGNTLNLAFGAGTGVADVTVTATDTFTGATLQEVFRVGVGVPVVSALDVAIGDGTQATVNFTDADGTRGTISLRGGTATVRFGGTNVTQAVNGRVIDVTGTGVEVLSIDTAGTTSRSRLSVTATGTDGLVPVNGINAPAPIGNVAARGALLRGTAAFAGTVGRLDLGRADNAAVNIGGTAQDRPATVFVGGLNDSDLTSGAPLRSLTLAVANNLNPEADVVTAPAIARFTSGGGYGGNLNVGSLGTARVTGGATGAWTAGDARSITVASTSPAWVGNFTGAVRSFTATEGMSGSLTAAAVNQLRVGNMAGANVTLTLAPGAGPALRRLTASAISDSNIRTSADIGTITANTITGSTVYAGVNVPAGSLLPTAATDFVAPATIRGVNVRSRTGTGFSDSAVAASNLGRINLGTVPTTNAGVPFGVSGQAIASVTAVLSTGEALRLRRLAEPTDGGTAGDFDVRVF